MMFYKNDNNKSSFLQKVSGGFKSFDAFVMKFVKRFKWFGIYYLATAAIFELAFRLDGRASTAALLQEISFDLRSFIYFNIVLVGMLVVWLIKLIIKGISKVAEFRKRKLDE